jgi:hypothetical protein
LVRLVTNEWSMNKDNVAQNRECFLVEITTNTSLEQLLSYFRKRCQVGKFGTEKQTLTDVEEASTSVLIRRSMKERTIALFSGVKEKPCIPPLDTTPPDTQEVISAELLHALGPLTTDSMRTHIPPDDEQVEVLRYLHAGLTNLLYRVQDDVICGDQLGEHRTVFVRHGPTQCMQISFYECIRHLQHSKYRLLFVYSLYAPPFFVRSSPNTR